MTLHLDYAGGPIRWFRAGGVVETRSEELDRKPVVLVPHLAEAEPFQLGAGIFPGVYPALDHLLFGHPFIMPLTPGDWDGAKTTRWRMGRQRQWCMIFTPSFWDRLSGIWKPDFIGFLFCPETYPF